MRPQLNNSEDIVVDNFPFGKIQLLFSESLGIYIYGGTVQIPQVIPKTPIRLIEAHKMTNASPDYSIDYLTPDQNGGGKWVQGAGVGWFVGKGTPLKHKDGVTEKERIDLSLSIGMGGASVSCKLWPADKQPDKKDWPEWYKPDIMGPLLWRIAYSPPRHAQPMRAAQQRQDYNLDDEIIY